MIIVFKVRNMKLPSTSLHPIHDTSVDAMRPFLIYILQVPDGQVIVISLLQSLTF